MNTELQKKSALYEKGRLFILHCSFFLSALFNGFGFQNCKTVECSKCDCANSSFFDKKSQEMLFLKFKTLPINKIVQYEVCHNRFVFI